MSSAPDKINIAVVGGGIAGLAAAHRILKESRDDSADGRHIIDLKLFEASSRLGGIIQTLNESDCVVELGPDSFTTLKPALLSLCREIGLEERLISTNENYRRAFIARRGVLNPIPEGFVLIAPRRFDTFFHSQLMSRAGKLRMAMEQFIPRGSFSEDESVASFVHRRFGPEAVGAIAQPMLGGIYTADIAKLSLRATMPQYLEYEEKFGSVTAGLKQSAKSKSESGARYSAFVSLDCGMQVLSDTLTRLITPERIQLNAQVRQLNAVAHNRWRLTLANGDTETFDRVVLAVPAAIAARLLGSFDQELSQLFARIEYASSVVACMVFARESVKHALDGFGFVVPAREKKNILASSFTSIKFAGRCPQDKVMIRVFMGGALAPATWQLSDDELLTRALSDLRGYLDVQGLPEHHWIKRWPNSMPQYNVGHLERVQAIESRIGKYDGLFYAGAGLRGVGLPDCVLSGEKAARAALANSLSSENGLSTAS